MPPTPSRQRAAAGLLALHSALLLAAFFTLAAVFEFPAVLRHPPERILELFLANATTTGAGDLTPGTVGQDSDPDGDAFSVADIDGETNPANDVTGTYGSLDWAADGTFTYTVDVNDPDYDGPLIQFAGGDGGGHPGDAGLWLSPLAVGSLDNPDFGTLDLRVAYLWRLGGRYEVDLFLDVFNALDDQATIRIQDLVGGGGGAAFGEGTDFVDPRRYFLGARLRF